MLILIKFSIKFETLAIYLSFISQRAAKAWIIDNCFIYAMINLMIVISKIFYYKYASRIFFIGFDPFVTEISFWCEKTSQGINFIFTYSRLGWSLMNIAIEIGVRHFFSTWALLRGGVNGQYIHLDQKLFYSRFSAEFSFKWFVKRKVRGSRNLIKL